MARPARLFLDAARLGAMSPTAQLAARDFARLAGEGLSTLYWEELLRNGRPTSRTSFQRRLPGLADWTGIKGLQTSVRRLLRLPSESPVVFASRGAAILNTAAQWLWTRCQNILVTDTLWPSYRKILEEQSLRGATTTVAIRDDICGRRLSTSQLVDGLIAAYLKNRCDGIVVSALSHDGVRIPTNQLLAALRMAAPVRAAVVDAAQEFAHVPVNLSAQNCDLYFAGCHKWLGAYQPLGVAVLPNQQTAAEILDWIATGTSADPLLRFLHQRTDELALETVNLAPLFSAWGALVDFHRTTPSQAQCFRCRLANARSASATASRLGWKPHPRIRGLRSGILLLQSEVAALREIPSEQLQHRIDAAGVTLTTYHEGTIRLSLTDRLLGPSDLALLGRALDPRRLAASHGHTMRA